MAGSRKSGGFLGLARLVTDPARLPALGGTHGNSGHSGASSLGGTRNLRPDHTTSGLADVGWSIVICAALILFSSSVWFTFIRPDTGSVGNGAPEQFEVPLSPAQVSDRTPDLHPAVTEVEEGGWWTIGLHDSSYRMPFGSADTKPTMEEFRWCKRLLIRVDILNRFTPIGSNIDHLLTDRQLLDNLCLTDRIMNAWFDAGETLGRTHQTFGLIATRDILDEARQMNPSLVMRSVLEESLPPGQSSVVTVREAQRILQVLGFYFGDVDGVGGPMTRQAIEKFQRFIGLPANGWLDLRTGTLLRNSVFMFSLNSFKN
ncbi:MAG: peptidoglycan-binding protein [Deltaproteobacteria bacterium]|nr:peptidoglycan-binding protein [Deltaproteobacteria bacterium]